MALWDVILYVGGKSGVLRWKMNEISVEICLLTVNSGICSSGNFAENEEWRVGLEYEE